MLSGSQGRRHSWLDDPTYDNIPAGDPVTAPNWYAADVVDWIRECRAPQEIGCHTLTHYYVDPGPAGREVFRRELELFLTLCDEHGLERPRTFIYPKAKMGHFDLLAEFGFRCYRGPENGWFESLPSEVLRAAVRLLDARGGRCPRVERPEMTADGVWMIPSSQFYSPFMSVGRYVSLESRVKKAVRGLHRAADTGGVYHLWTHPFNLGVRTDELLDGFREILREANRLRFRGELDILPMGVIAEQLDEESPLTCESRAADPEPEAALV